jgi:hypothetical protein
MKTIEVAKTMDEIKQIIQQNGKIIDEDKIRDWKCFWTVENEKGVVEIYYRWSPLAQRNEKSENRNNIKVIYSS